MLAKLERGHACDLDDGSEFVKRGLIDTEELLRLFGKIEQQLLRYPQIDPALFRESVESFIHALSLVTAKRGPLENNDSICSIDPTPDAVLDS